MPATAAAASSPMRSTNGYSFATQQFLTKYGILDQRSGPAAGSSNQRQNRQHKQTNLQYGTARGQQPAYEDDGDCSCDECGHECN